MKIFAKYLIALFIFSACKEAEKVKIVIDNPLVSDIEVRIEDTILKIPAEGMQELELAVGEHQFETKLEQSTLKGSFSVEKEGLLNATGSEYVLWKELFLSQEVTPEEGEAIYVSVLKEDSIVLEGVKYFGEFTKYGKDKYFIPKTWEFNTITNFPEKPSMNARYETKKKIFRKMPFIHEYEERYAFDEKETKRIYDSILKEIHK